MDTAFHVKYPLFLSDFIRTSIFSTDFQKNHQISNFLQTRASELNLYLHKTWQVYQRTHSLGIFFIWITNWKADNTDIRKLKKCHYIHTHLTPYVCRVSKISDIMLDFNDILYTRALW